MAGAEQFREAAAEAIAQQGVFRVALSGGSTPRLLHARLVSRFRRRIAWEAVRFFFGDERCVPPDSDRSNYQMARETLLDPLRIPTENVFRMKGEEESGRAAEEYRGVLSREFPGEALPRFDLVFLGMGPDGHTASLFPGSRALALSRRPVAANWVPKLSEWRLTLTYPALNAARRIVFLVTGEEKRPAAERIFKRRKGWLDLPAARVRPSAGSLLWLMDEGAGGTL